MKQYGSMATIEMTQILLVVRCGLELGYTDIKTGLEMGHIEIRKIGL